MGNFKDLTGMKFGRLTVIKQYDRKTFPSGACHIRWLCRCDCGSEKDVVVDGSYLTNGHTQSCGCIKMEKIRTLAKRTCKKYNDYEIQEDYVIMYTTKGEPFYVDLEDFWKVKDICWYKNKYGYFVHSIGNNQLIWLHRVIMNCPDDMKVDHINGSDTTNDNRKSNLRIVTQQQNCYNSKPSKKNTSGKKGVSYNKKRKKWRARITVNKKEIHLGEFENFEDACRVRDEAELKYFGEYSYNLRDNIIKENINNEKISC